MNMVDELGRRVAFTAASLTGANGAPRTVASSTQPVMQR